MTLTRQERWQIAQTWERAWWRGVVDQIDPAFYRAFARTVEDELAGLVALGPDTRVLEVGSGAAGIVTYLPGRRCAVDPLEDYYATVPRFTEARDPSVRYFAARGEDLPFDDAAFDLVISDNVLDHCESPERVLAEVRRVLRPGGVLYLRLNLYHRWGRFVRTLIEVLHIDRGHPYTFTRRGLDRLLAGAGFAVVRTRASGFRRTWLRELTSGRPKDLAKALTFATRNKTSFVARRAD